MRLKKIDVCVMLLLVITIAVLGSLLGARASSAVDVYVNAEKWPMWPEPYVRINERDITEPAMFLSIGREVVPWTYFGDTTVDSNNYVKLVGANFYVTVEKFTYDYEYDPEENKIKKVKRILSYVTTPPTISDEDDLFMIAQNSHVDTTSVSDIAYNLREIAVFPEYVSNWITYTVDSEDVQVANESFLADRSVDEYVYINDWKDFLVRDLAYLNLPGVDSADVVYADSGHAPPQVVWPYDPWLFSFRAKTGYYADEIPEKWKNRYVCLWPTNQGALHAYEVYNVEEPDSTPYASRTWLAVPEPSFRQAIYEQLKKAYGNDYMRFTVLDGPITIRDVKINGEWRRILVGVTGEGTKQLPKPQDAWTTLNQSDYDPTTSSPTLQNGGRVFGVYAFDITDLGETADTNTLKPLWSVTTVSYGTSAKVFSDYYPQNNTGADKSEYAAYANMLFSVSKPVIGYTRDENGNMKWHVVILGVEKPDANNNHKYMWLDVDPQDGHVISQGYFYNPAKGDYEALEDASFVEEGDFTPEEVERAFPSRILPAFPPPDAEYQEPLLSDIYVQLSNGGLYRWNLLYEGSDANPKWIVTLKSERGDNIAPPLTDFDITHVYGDNPSAYHTYFAGNVLLRNVSGNASLDTETLVILDLTELQSMSIEERSSVKVPPGQDGTVVSSKESHILVVQLELQKGTSSTYSKNVLASPVFINNRLFLAIYEMSTKGQGNNPNYSEVSRLYVFNFAPLMGSGNVQQLQEAQVVDDQIEGDYFDVENVEAAMMFVDSLGNLVMLDQEGNVIGDPIPTGLTLNTDPPDPDLDNRGVKLVYWKKS